MKKKGSRIEIQMNWKKKKQGKDNSKNDEDSE